MTGRHLTGEDRTRVRTDAARRYMAGSTIQSVARQIGFSYGTTRTLLIEAGVRLRRPGGARSTTFRKTS